MESTVEVATEIKQFLVNECGLEESKITHDVDLFQSGLLDSFEVQQILSFLEDRWQVKAPVFEVSFENFATINKITSFVTKSLQNPGNR